MKKIIVLVLVQMLVLPQLSKAQNYFTDYKKGESFFEKKDYKAAAEAFSKVIDIKHEHYRAYNYRGKCYLELGEYEKSVKDFTNAIEVKPKEEEYYFNRAKAYSGLKKYKEAIEDFAMAIEHDKKMLVAYDEKAIAHINIMEYQNAVNTIEEAQKVSKTGFNYYLKGRALDSLMRYDEAAPAFDRAIYFEPDLVDARIGLAHAKMHLKEYEKAIAAIDKVLEKDKLNVKALKVKSDIYYAQKDYAKAIENLSNIIVADAENKNAFFLRGKYYHEFGQYQNAILDFTKLIKLDKEHFMAFYNRAKSYEALLQYKEAIKDYESLRRLSPYDEKAKKLHTEAIARLYELNKEENNPTIVMIDPISPKEGVVEVAMNKDKMVVKGQIKDESNIEFIKVNNVDAIFNKDTLNPLFEAEISLVDVKEITVTAFDVYQNSESQIFTIKETEVNPPIVKLIAPYASDDGTVYLDSDDPSLYVEGQIDDQSLIKSIFIEGSTASFVLDKKNPTFSATINIMNKNEITVVAEDIYGNKTEKIFTLNREDVALLGDNPMGKTWVIFIDNSNYTSFASLDGPGKDVTMMKSAFAKYKINNIIHKKDMTKAQLEKFFSIELRDLVRSNRVKSLLVWYAGHGKFINETGYWIPVDAKRDEEFTYFNINNLKAAMQSYSKYITHTLVITDACESGPSFYQAMRSTVKAKSCNDWQATKFKSSQVFSSAGYELASDNSQFTKTFANTLSNNPNSCIPIETIVTKVTAAVAKSNSQKPKFGKINGLEDENGTFFFIKK